MFDSLTSRLSEVFGHLTSRGVLTSTDVEKALREVRIALLEADVALAVVKNFVDQVKERAVGVEVLNSVTPGQMVIKIVHENLVKMLGSELVPITLNANPPSVIMLVGLQGSGKTTTAAKLAFRFKNQQNKKALLASLDINRPAAQEQLAVLGRQAEVNTLPTVQGQLPAAIAERALQAARLGGHDLLILDTAGRLHNKVNLMEELKKIRRSLAKHDLGAPHETLLVLDGTSGQNALIQAREFNQATELTGFALTKLDGTAKGGIVVALRREMDLPVKLIGVGEGVDDLQPFDGAAFAKALFAE